MEISVVGVNFKSLLVDIDSFVDFVLVKESASFSLIASWPSGIHFDASLSVFQSFVVLLIVEVRSRSVGIEYVIVGIVLNGFGKQLNGLFVTLRLKGLVAFVFKLCGKLGVAH